MELPVFPMAGILYRHPRTFRHEGLLSPSVGRCAAGSERCQTLFHPLQSLLLLLHLLLHLMLLLLQLLLLTSFRTVLDLENLSHELLQRVGTGKGCFSW